MYSETIIERLGFKRDDRLLVVHADDLGATHSINSATIKAFETGSVNSGSIMVPCSWFPEIAAYANKHTKFDFGLHLTLTSERSSCRWGPVASKNKVPSLIDRHGYFHQTWTDVIHIDPKEAEIEMRAQVEMAKAFGFQPTHLDSHQYRNYQHGEALFRVLLQIGREYKIPVFVARSWFSTWPYLESCLPSTGIAIDNTVTIPPEIPPGEWATFYTNAVKSLPCGITEFVIHLGYDDEEMRAFSIDRSTWGAAWRQRDFDVFTSPWFSRLLQEQNVKLTSWSEIGASLFNRSL